MERAGGANDPVPAAVSCCSGHGHWIKGGVAFRRGLLTESIRGVEHRHQQTTHTSALSERSLHRKATRLLDGRQQLVIQLLVRLVGRDVNPVEAGVGFG